MTRLAVLADIHANLHALSAVADDLEQRNVDHVIVAGDVINWGPFSRQVLEFIANRGWAVIRGNHEYYLLDFDTPRAPAAWDDHDNFTLPPWLRRQLAGKWLHTIAAWPDVISLRFPDAPPMLVVHGSPRSPWEPIYPSTPPEVVEAMLTDVEETTIIAAHTHLVMNMTLGHRRILNPGSVGVPLDGIFGASYMILKSRADGWDSQFYHVSYDCEPLFREFERQGFIVECGITGRLVIEEFRTARPQIAPFYRWREENYPNEPLTQQLFDKFTQSDTTEYMMAPYRLDTIRAYSPR